MLSKDLASKYLKPLYPIPSDLTPRGKLNHRIECILFDVYGTLFISASGDIGANHNPLETEQKIEPLLKKFEITRPPQALLEDFYRTIKKRHAESKQKGIDFPEVQIEHIWMKILDDMDRNKARKFALEFELITNPVFPMPLLKEVLFACKERKIVMGIISNGQFFTLPLFPFFLGADMEALGFDRDLIFLSYRFGYAKPSLFLFNRAVEKLKHRKINPCSVLYLGNDMLNDIYPAKQVGFNTVLFAGDSRSLRLRPDDPRCKTLNADLVITDLKQLLEHIK